MKKIRIGTACAIAALSVAPMAAAAQDATSTEDTASSQEATTTTGRVSASDALMGDIVVIGTKKSAGEALQDVPASITALGSDQLEALQFRSLESLTYAVPNVQLDQLGTFKAVANFTIRGLGVNSSTPSVDPAVGTFVDGVYLGVNFGVVVDTFDVESIEIMRGPQGVLFGRNVTGGAVSIRTARPDGTFRARARVNYETRENYTYAGSIEGALVEDVLFAKLTGYYNDDNGYFYNRNYNRHVGKNDTWFLRPTLVFKPSDTAEFTLIGETFKLTGEGPVSRNPNYARPFETTADHIGYSYLRANSLTSESVFDVGPGDGRITNIANYREIKQRNSFDLDAHAGDLSFVDNYLEQYQLSNELRYSVRLRDTIDLVTGVYLFKQHMLYIERNTNRPLATPVTEGGGQTDQRSIGLFINADVNLTDNLILTLGGRYSHDVKEADINFRRAIPQPCQIATEACTSFPDYSGKVSFSSFIPKVGLKYQINPDAQLYALYTKGYRSGGFNLKAQSQGAAQPFGDEQTDSLEIGLKSDLFDRRVRFNLAAFYNNAKDLQRQGTFNLPTGPLSLVGNGADARIKGIEADLTVKVATGFVLNATLGITDGKYTSVTADLNGDGAIDAVDANLKLPRLAPVTYGFGAYFDTFVDGFGEFGAQITFNHRDGSWFNDPNTGWLPAFDDLAANLSVQPDFLKGLKISLYGKNLLKKEMTGNNSPLPLFPQGGGAIWFPTRGRVLGVEVDMKF